MLNMCLFFLVIIIVSRLLSLIKSEVDERKNGSKNVQTVIATVMSILHSEPIHAWKLQLNVVSTL